VPQDLDQRLERLYASVGATLERRSERFGVEVKGRPGAVCISFRGGQTDAQLENAAMQAIFHVAHLRDHLRRWAKAQGLAPELVDVAVEKSNPLKILIDLANTDKHGPARDGGLTKVSPRLSGLTRALRLGGGSIPPVLEIPLGGGGKVTSVGNTAAVITGDVLDRDGKRIGELQELLQAGVAEWEGLLESFKPKNGSA
jgi:hypothetical protein